MGDLLSLLAAMVWACYVILTRKISAWGWNTILTTRRTFCWGILWALTKRALLAAGEIQPEGRTSARTKNA